MAVQWLAWHIKGRVSSPRLLQQVLRFVARIYMHRAIRGAQEALPCVGCGATASQLDLQSLQPLSVAGCGRLQLGDPHRATSVALVQVVVN